MKAELEHKPNNSQETKKKQEWKKRFLIISILLVVVIASGYYGFRDEEWNIYFTSNDKLKGIKLPSSSSYIYNEGSLTYSVQTNGIVTIRNILNQTIAKMGFAISGRIDGVNNIYTNENFTWTWSRDNYSIIQEEYLTIEDMENNIITNVSYRVDVFTGYNNQGNFNWTQVWEFSALTRFVKMKHIITNNLGKNITNATFWYISTISENDRIRFNNSDYNINMNNSMHLKGNFNNVLGKIDFLDHVFFYNDLIENGFDITDIYLGDAELIGRKGIPIFAVGVTKGNSILEDGKTITLDPLDTGFKSPDEAGDPLSQWTNPNNIKISDNNYATETTLQEMMDTSNYTFNIPDSATIVGIEIKLEGRSQIPRIGCPE